MRASKQIFLSLLVLTLTGCANVQVFVKQSDKKVPVPTSDTAVITFLRPTTYAATMPFAIWDGDKLIGQLQGQELFHYTASSGRHMFLTRADKEVIGEWGYLRAELKSGKHYYVEMKVFPIMRSFFGGLRIFGILVPLNMKDQADITKWLSECKQNELIPDAASTYSQSNIDFLRTANNKEAIEAASKDTILFNTMSADGYIE